MSYSATRYAVQRMPKTDTEPSRTRTAKRASRDLRIARRAKHVGTVR